MSHGEDGAQGSKAAYATEYEDASNFEGPAERLGPERDSAIMAELDNVIEWLKELFSVDFEGFDVDVTGAMGFGPLQKSVSLGSSGVFLGPGAKASKGGVGAAVWAEACVMGTFRLASPSDASAKAAFGFDVGVGYHSLQVRVTQDKDVSVSACSGISTDRLSPRVTIQRVGEASWDATTLGTQRHDVPPTKIDNLP